MFKSEEMAESKEKSTKLISGERTGVQSSDQLQGDQQKRAHIK
jgi:hypothetical protein